MKRTFLFAIIASILSINAYAVSATVTSKDYVDAADATKQDKLPSKNVTTTIDETEMDVPSIVLYPANGENAGNIGEVGFVSTELADAKRNEIVAEINGQPNYSLRFLNWLGDWLYDTSNRGGVSDYAISGRVLALTIGEMINQIESKTMTCAGWPDGVAHTDENCWLWNKN